MIVSALTAWKLVLTILLLAGLVVSLRGRAPRHTIPGTDMRRLVFGALSLYAVGAAAWITHHEALAVAVYAAGIATAALAAWLSRGHDPGDPPRGDERHEGPPPDPDGLGFDWSAFERELLAYTERSRARTGS